MRAEEAAHGDPAEQGANVVIVDAVPLRVATQERGADQHTDGDDDSEGLDREPDVELAHVKEGQAGEA